MEETITIENLEVCLDDLGKMTWQEAIDTAANLGPGWRLPTIEEFTDTLYPNGKKIFNISDDEYYWSSTAFDDKYSYTFNFFYGNAYNFTKNYKTSVRAVRDWNAEIALGILLKEF